MWCGGYKEGEVWGEANPRTDIAFNFLHSTKCEMNTTSNKKQTTLRLWTVAELVGMDSTKWILDRTMALAQERADTREEDNIINIAWDNICKEPNISTFSTQPNHHHPQPGRSELFESTGRAVAVPVSPGGSPEDLSGTHPHPHHQQPGSLTLGGPAGRATPISSSSYKNRKSKNNYRRTLPGTEDKPTPGTSVLPPSPSLAQHT